MMLGTLTSHHLQAKLPFICNPEVGTKNTLSLDSFLSMDCKGASQRLSLHIGRLSWVELMTLPSSCLNDNAFLIYLADFSRLNACR